MSELTYEYLPAEEQRSQIESRLLGLEREHQIAVLELDTAGPNADEAMQSRKSNLEERIKTLRARRDAIKEPSKAPTA